MQSTTIEVLPTSEFRESMEDCLFNHLVNMLQTSTGFRLYEDEDETVDSGTVVDESKIGKVLLNARFGGECTENEISIDIVTLATASTEEKLVRFTSEFVEGSFPVSFPEAFHSVVLYLKDTYQDYEQEKALVFFASFYAMWIHMDYVHEVIGELEQCSLEIPRLYEEWLKTR